MGGQSEKDFLNKLSISYKEARETEYWIRLMFEVGLISNEEKKSLASEIKEILKLLGAIRRTMKQKIGKSND